MGAAIERVEQAGATRRLPDYLPARMVNEFVYCPRLFFYEWVENLFAESADTLEGRLQHARVDSGTGALPAPEATAPPEVRHSRSVTLASESWRGDCEAGPDRDHRRHADARGLQAGQPAGERDGAGGVAGGSGATGRAGADSARERVLLRRGRAVVRANAATGAGAV